MRESFKKFADLASLQKHNKYKKKLTDIRYTQVGENDLVEQFKKKDCTE